MTAKICHQHFFNRFMSTVMNLYKTFVYHDIFNHVLPFEKGIITLRCASFKPCNISVTPKTVKKAIMNLDSSKPSGPDCIPVVVL